MIRYTRNGDVRMHFHTCHRCKKSFRTPHHTGKYCKPCQKPTGSAGHKGNIVSLKETLNKHGIVCMATGM